MAHPDEDNRPAGQTPPAGKKARTTGAMHEDVPDWSDPCCSCEAEPYWTETAEDTENARESSGATAPPK